MIGGCVAQRLLAEGARVVGTDIAPEGLRRLDASIHTFDVDLSSESEVTKFASEVIAQFGQIDFLLNVAGGELRPSRAFPDVLRSPGMHPIESVDFDLWTRT